ncbi:hypothetical protein CFter6_3871 [Collimonas fungivorans]|uniref:Uncharacterized protein n=1 Tax=Collimonas fungivorans TaxID=158899 RepID=A0A127PFA9_9BURK|nr:hypothetical protein CFter6_3871 [Collimonas fungivorans]
MDLCLNRHGRRGQAVELSSVQSILNVATSGCSFDIQLVAMVHICAYFMQNRPQSGPEWKLQRHLPWGWRII